MCPKIKKTIKAQLHWCFQAFIRSESQIRSFEQEAPTETVKSCIKAFLLLEVQTHLLSNSGSTAAERVVNVAPSMSRTTQPGGEKIYHFH